MTLKRPFQIFVLLTLLFSPFGLTHLRASASSIDQSGVFQTQPTVSMSVSPARINIGGTATVTVRLDNVPAEGYTSLELTCTYYPNLVEASDILVADLFGAGKYPAKSGVREARIAAEFRLRRLFEHDDIRRARLFRCDRRLERGAATTDHDHRDVFSSHD